MDVDVHWAAQLIFSRGGLTEENRVISLNKQADSLEKVTTVKWVARVLLHCLFKRMYVAHFIQRKMRVTRKRS